MEKALGRAVLVCSPGMIRAAVQESGPDWVVSIYRSVLVKDGQPLMAPVLEFLGTVCHTPGKHERVRDVDMMFRTAEEVEHLIHEVCPGNDVPHTCAATGEGMA